MKWVKLSVRVGDLRDAHQSVRRAEGFRELRDQDKYAATDICHQLCVEYAEPGWASTDGRFHTPLQLTSTCGADCCCFYVDEIVVGHR